MHEGCGLHQLPVWFAVRRAGAQEHLFWGALCCYEGQMCEDRWPLRSPSSPGPAVTGYKAPVAMCGHPG